MRLTASLRNIVQNLTSMAKAGKMPDSYLERNIGESVMEWPERYITVRRILDEVRLAGDSPTVGDYGCGTQALRSVIPAHWVYIPYDYLKRSPDTFVFNFNETLPGTCHDLIFCLGVLEYLTDPLRLLRHVISHSSVVIFDYNGPTTMERRRLQGWKNNLTFEEIEGALAECHAEIVERVDYAAGQRLYLCRCLART